MHTVCFIVFIVKDLMQKISKKIIEKLEIVLEKTLLCWIHLRLSTKMVKIHWIEDHFLIKFKNTL